MKFFFHDAILQNDGKVRRITSQETVVRPEAPYLRELYVLLQKHRHESDRKEFPYGFSCLGTRAYDEIVYPWLPKAQTAISEMEKYRSLGTLGNIDNIDADDQFQWYAFSRVNDEMLADLARMRPYHPPAIPKEHETNYAEFLSADHAEHQKRRSKHEEQYVQFFRELGFSVYYDQPFHPFYHEIVEVIYDDEVAPGEIVVGYVCWPGVMFGEMMFSRAGVRVLCREGSLNKEIAEKSILYFTYSRPNRATFDLSRGWGSNSQWATDFRLDYEDATTFHFHVQGDYQLGEDYVAMLPQYKRDHLDDLTMDERIELLTHRCFVTCPKNDTDRWPFSDRYKMPKAKPSVTQPD